jgi:deoxyribose-phosphate aldolase
MSLEKQIAAALNACVPLSPDHQLVLPHLTGAELAAMIDHTLLHAAARRDDLIKLCGEAKTYGFAAVCVNPVWVGECQNLLQDSQIPVCSVIGFPLGATGADLKAREASWVVDCGAREVDMVVHVGALLNREYAVVAKEIELVVKVAHPWPVKVILETGLLKTEEIVAGCIIARNSGAPLCQNLDRLRPRRSNGRGGACNAANRGFVPGCQGFWGNQRSTSGFADDRGRRQSNRHKFWSKDQFRRGCLTRQASSAFASMNALMQLADQACVDNNPLFLQAEQGCSDRWFKLGIDKLDQIS